MKNRFMCFCGLLFALTSFSATAVELKTDKQRLSYAYGQMAVMTMKLEGAELDPEIVLQAVRDGLEGREPALSRQETFDAINKSRASRNPQGAAAARQNLVDGQDFLRRNRNKEGVIERASGLQYRILKEGTGRRPKPADIIVAHYTGTLVDGTKFDSSRDRGEPATFGVNRVIAGWSEALQLMREGAKWRLFIPSDLAYGARGVGDVIKPHSALIFDVELISIKD